MAWTLAVFKFIYGTHAHPVFADVAAVFFAQYLPYLLVAGFLVLAFREPGARRKFYLFAEGSLAIILARGIITESIGFFYRTARPFAVLGFSSLISESGPSFPSGHMAWFFALALVVWFVNRKWGVWYFALTIVMGVARIYVGVHWPIDIVGGAAVGLVSGWFIHWLLRKDRMALAEPAKADGF